MAKRGTLLDFLTLDRRSPTPLYGQLFAQIRDAILEGALAPGVRMPSTRALAKHLSVGRNTVTVAYEMLAAEEYLIPRGAAGTRVADLPALRAVTSPSAAAGDGAAPAPLSRRGAAICGAARYLPEYRDRAFAAGLPALEHFPHTLWARGVSRRARQSLARTLDYGEIAGAPELRRAIAAHLATARGFRPDPDRIVVVNGAQAALDLLARIVTDPGDTVWIEEPGYLGARGAFRAAGARIEPIPVDAAGLAVASAPPGGAPPKLIYTTPSHQCPTGVTLSLERRLALLQAARAAGALIVEDDYDSEFRYAGPPISPLWSLDRGRSVVYMGTFSKTLYPGIKIGYLVASPALADALRRALFHTGQSANKTVQLALADFIEEGRFAEHIRSMKALYETRRAAFLDALKAELGGAVVWAPADTGMQQALFFNDPVDEARVAREAQARGVTAPTLARFYLGPAPRRGLFLGFAAVAPQDAARGLRQLAAAVEAAGRSR